MKCGSGKMGELTFEQPEEIAFFRKSKTGRFSPLYDSEPGAFCAKESGTAGKIMFPSFVFAKDGIFYFRKKPSEKLFQHKLEEPKNERL